MSRNLSRRIGDRVAMRERMRKIEMGAGSLCVAAVLFTSPCAAQYPIDIPAESAQAAPSEDVATTGATQPAEALARVCQYESENETITVTVDDVDTRLGVRVSRATLTPGNEWGDLRAQVRGSLEFEGQSSSRILRTTEDRRIDGFGILPSGLLVTQARSLGATVATRVLLTWQSPDGSRYQTHVTAEYDCDQLAVYRGAEDRYRRVIASRGDLVFGPNTLTIHARPGTGGTLELFAPAGVSLFRRQQRRGWTRVEVPSSQGAVLTGWVESDALATSRPEQARTLDTLIAGSGSGRPPDELPSLRRRANLRVGASVFASPGDGRWATVRSGDDFVVREFPESEWLLIESAPDATLAWASRAPLRFGWVRRSDVEHLEPLE